MKKIAAIAALAVFMLAGVSAMGKKDQVPPVTEETAVEAQAVEGEVPVEEVAPVEGEVPAEEVLPVEESEQKYIFVSIPNIR